MLHAELKHKVFRGHDVNIKTTTTKLNLIKNKKPGRFKHAGEWRLCFRSCEQDPPAVHGDKRTDSQQ